MENTQSCFNRLCMKFVICSVISLATIALGMVLLLVDRFKNLTITTFATNLITLNLTFWLEPPRITEKIQRVDSSTNL